MGEFASEGSADNIVSAFFLTFKFLQLVNNSNSQI